MGVYSRSTLFTITYYLFLAVFVTFKNIIMGIFFALPSLRHVIHISYTLTVTLKEVGYSISAAVKTEVLWLYVT